MKNRLWLLQLPVALLLSAAFLVTETGMQGKLSNSFLRETIYPNLLRVSAFFTDLKFHSRGPRPPRNKIVVVEIDSASLEAFGRWPWHRDITAALIEKIFSYGPKVVGLDIFFSEPDQRVPDELADALKQKGLGSLVPRFETDHRLTETIASHRDNLVLGWATEAVCQPLYEGPENCPVSNPDALALFPQGFDRFSIGDVDIDGGAFKAAETPILSVVTMLSNLPEYQSAALHSGYLNALLDPDGHIRRTNLVAAAHGGLYPSLPLKMAEVGMGEKLQARIDKGLRLTDLRFKSQGRALPVNLTGVMDVNFRGPGHTFPYVSAYDLIAPDADGADGQGGRRLASSLEESIRDAYVLVGISAVGVFDMRAFPFDSNVPGVEGHANILDNLLSGDPLVTSSESGASWLILVLMIFGSLGIAYYAQKLEAVPALILFVAVMGSAALIDFKVLFAHDRNWNTGFFYIELAASFGFIVAAKYILEERNKKFISTAFAKYVAPAVVDSILKDPAKLSLGGEKKELTILFSDIRNFTTFSEKLDAKVLASFLNDYLGIMTRIVFAHEGTLDKYIGDAIMAFWGAPLDQPRHAENAAKAAIAMFQALHEHRARFKQQYDIDVSIGIGINSGVVNVGNMGSEQTFEYTVIGDHVNLASRLEGLTKTYGAGIVTSRFTFDLIAKAGQPLPRHRVLDFVKVKGKKVAVELIEIISGDLPDDATKLFEEGRALYARRKWDEAAAKFREADTRRTGGDGPSRLYLERCEALKKDPPPESWDGSWEMLSK